MKFKINEKRGVLRREKEKGGDKTEERETEWWDPIGGLSLSEGTMLVGSVNAVGLSDVFTLMGRELTSG